MHFIWLATWNWAWEATLLEKYYHWFHTQVQTCLLREISSTNGQECFGLEIDDFRA
jgi:hypothetical protein